MRRAIALMSRFACSTETPSRSRATALSLCESARVQLLMISLSARIEMEPELPIRDVVP
jgi:hypothetical protein